MKLNPDCVRDILLYIEENTDSRHLAVPAQSLVNDLSNQYDENTIYYHVFKIDDAGFVDSVAYVGVSTPIDIGTLSWKGHEFLSNIRGDNVWKDTKSIANKVGSCSLDLLSKIAVGVLTQIINKQLRY